MSRSTVCLARLDDCWAISMKVASELLYSLADGSEVVFDFDENVTCDGLRFAHVRRNLASEIANGISKYLRFLRII
jgi:hypothetical protein